MKFLGSSTFIMFTSSKSEGLVCAGCPWWKVEIYTLKEERGLDLLFIGYISFLPQAPVPDKQLSEFP